MEQAVVLNAQQELSTEKVENRSSQGELKNLFEHVQRDCLVFLALKKILNGIFRKKISLISLLFHIAHSISCCWLHRVLAHKNSPIMLF